MAKWRGCHDRNGFFSFRVGEVLGRSTQGSLLSLSICTGAPAMIRTRSESGEQTPSFTSVALRIFFCLRSLSARCVLGSRAVAYRFTVCCLGGIVLGGAERGAAA